MARPHPFAAPAEELAAIFAGEPDDATLLLPSLRSSPLDSPQVFRASPRPAPRTAPMLLPWTVPVLRMTADDATAALGPRCTASIVAASRSGASK